MTLTERLAPYTITTTGTLRQPRTLTILDMRVHAIRRRLAPYTIHRGHVLAA